MCIGMGLAKQYTKHLAIQALVVVLAFGVLVPQGFAAEEKAPVRLYDTVEFRAPLKSLTSWLNVLERNQQDPGLTPGKALGARGKWDDVLGSWKGLSPKEQLNKVNTFFNQWPYRLDIDNYKMADYWATPLEFIKKSGDCEDYAIIKYFALKQLGFNPEDMRVVIVRRTLFNDVHAVLAVYLDGDAFILDNLSSVVVSHSKNNSYAPQFSVNEFHRWNHFPINKKAPAAKQ